MSAPEQAQSQSPVLPLDQSAQAANPVSRDCKSLLVSSLTLELLTEYLLLLA